MTGILKRSPIPLSLYRVTKLFALFLHSVGYFVQPTIVQTKNPLNKIMTEEIFGPVLTVYVYKDSAIEETLELIDTSTPYALTGAVFAQDE